jgi:hypothetical protein
MTHELLKIEMLLTSEQGISIVDNFESPNWASK